MGERGLTARGVAALRAGDRDAARALLAAAVRADPADATAWLWLSGALPEPEAQRYCLERALALDPACEPARAGLAALGAPTGERAELLGRDPGARGAGPHQDELLPAPPSPNEGEGGRGDEGKREGIRPVRHAGPSWAPWALAALAGVGVALAWAAWRGLGAELWAPELLALAAAAGAPVGLVALLLAGVLLRLGGRLLGGRAGAAEVRAALGWSLAPAAGGLALWLAQLALLPASFAGPPPWPSVAAALWVAHGGLWAWSAARSVAALAAAHGLPAWRAAAAWILAALALAGGAGALLGGAALVIGLRGG